MTRAASQVYESLDGVLEDLDAAILDMEEKMQLPNSAARNHYMPVGSAHSELGLKVSAFQKKAHELVRRHKISMEQEQKKDSDLNGSNGKGDKRTQVSMASGDNKRVLTLYGNAPGPKQLFSSFQLPTSVEGEVKQITPLIREGGLPTGITTTQIVPMPSSNLVETKKATLGDVFPSPANILPLQPPKRSPNSTTKDTVVGWYQPSSVDPRQKSASYSMANVSCGQWLDYSNASSPKSSRKRHRDRALSLGGSKLVAPETDSAEAEAAKREALFRSAYSSFAPTKDNTAAIMPTGMLERLWWQQSGERAYKRAVENVTELTASMKTDPEAMNIVDGDEEIKKFEEAVEGWEKDVVDPSLVELAPADEKSIQEKDVEEVLEGISELLETLNSYQRIRHMSLNPTIRAGGGLLSAPDTSTLGSPSKPSDAEQATYEMLKAQLSLMIATLPPYAVAKLDADRLSELRVSTKIEVQVDDFRGVMEEDETAAKARALATASAANVARVQQPIIHRSTPAAAQGYGNQFSAPRPVPAASHQYYGGAQTPSRAPPPNMQRTPATAPVPYQPRPAAAAPFRPPQQGYNTPNYGHTAPRPVQQYTSSSQPQQYMQTPAAQSYLRAPSHSYQGAPQTAPQNAMNGRGYPQLAYPHQTQTTQNAPDYRYNATSAMANRQNSPQMPMYSQASPVQTRQAYSTPTPAVPQGSRQYVQNPMMTGGSPQVAQPSSYNSSQSTGYSTFMTQEQQAGLMERQRAQLAQQQQQNARAAQAALGTPSQPQVNGTNAVIAGL